MRSRSHEIGDLHVHFIEILRFKATRYLSCSALEVCHAEVCSVLGCCVVLYNIGSIVHHSMMIPPLRFDRLDNKCFPIELNIEPFRDL